MMAIRTFRNLLLSIYDGYQESQESFAEHLWWLSGLSDNETWYACIADASEYAIEYRINVFARPALAGLVCVFEFELLDIIYGNKENEIEFCKPSNPSKIENRLLNIIYNNNAYYITKPGNIT